MVEWGSVPGVLVMCALAELKVELPASEHGGRVGGVRITNEDVWALSQTYVTQSQRRRLEF